MCPRKSRATFRDLGSSIFSGKKMWTSRREKSVLAEKVLRLMCNGTRLSPDYADYRETLAPCSEVGGSGMHLADLRHRGMERREIRASASKSRQVIYFRSDWRNWILGKTFAIAEVILWLAKKTGNLQDRSLEASFVNCEYSCKRTNQFQLFFYLSKFYKIVGLEVY